MSIIQSLIDEMTPDPLVDDEEIYKLKEIVLNLPQNDKVIMLLYIEYNSLQKVADILHVSQSTIFLHVRRIRKEIKNQLI